MPPAGKASDAGMGVMHDLLIMVEGGSHIRHVSRERDFLFTPCLCCSQNESPCDIMRFR